MGVSNLSDTVVRKILTNLREKVSAEIVGKPKPGESLVFNDKSIFAEGVRINSNALQDGLMSQRSLTLLTKEFQRAYSTPTTRDKFIKKKVSEYKSYPAVYALLNNTDIDVVAEIGILIDKTIKVLSIPDLYDDFIVYYTKTYPADTLIVDSANKELIAKNLTHAEFNKRFKAFLLTKTTPIVADFFDANTDAGHFLGVFNAKFAKILDLDITPGTSYNDFTVTSKGLSGFTGSDAKSRDTILKSYKDILTLLSEADFLSGNLIGNINLVSKTSKEVYGQFGNRSAVEIQLSYLNSRAGRKINTLGKKIQSLAKSAYFASTENIPGSIEQQLSIRDFRKSLAGLFTSIESIGKYIEELADFYDSKNILKPAELELVKELRSKAVNIAETLVQTSGSDSIIKAIKNTVTSPLTGAKVPSTQKTKVQNSLGIKSKAKSKLSTGTVSVKNKPATLLTSIKKRIVNTYFSTTNLVSLQNLINDGLVDRVKANMGSGDRRDVLNLRSGRFAESVKVQSLSESRAGMITAFYTYMKNPYATFSAGGQQSSPQTRDPKLLIAKSIRELAAQQVQNRLRSVVI